MAKNSALTIESGFEVRS